MAATPQGRSSVGHNLGVVVRALVVLVGFTLAIAAAGWFILVSTVMATPSISGTAWVTQRAAWTAGGAPNGSVVIATTNPVSHDIGGRISEVFSGYPDASVVRIVAGPTQEVVSTLDGALIVDGKKTSYTVDTPIAPTTLQDEYLALCLSGACGTPGTQVLVPSTNVIGKVLTGISWSGPVDVSTLSTGTGS